MFTIQLTGEQLDYLASLIASRPIAGALGLFQTIQQQVAAQAQPQAEEEAA